MFPIELMQIISKYKSSNQTQIRNIYNNLLEITTSLKSIKNNIASDAYKMMKSDEIADTTEIISDINTLKEQISYIESFTVNRKYKKSADMECHEEEDCGKVIIPMFTQRIYPYLISDDLCPFCNVKLVQNNILYQRIKDNKINKESMVCHRCPACNQLFIMDYEVDGFDFENTNISVNRNKYEEILPIDIYDIIVLRNTLKCSSNHDTKDIIAKLPVLNEYGEISYISVNASYCPTCNRYTMLKDDFNAIAGVVTCKVIDETVSYNSDNSEFDMVIDTKHSILAQYGYNVQTKKDLSEQQRHIILSSIIEAQIMNRREVIDHITTLIERGSKIPNWKYATQKWKDDKRFVSEYQSNNLPEVVFKKIILKYRNRK